MPQSGYRTLPIDSDISLVLPTAFVLTFAGPRGDLHLAESATLLCAEVAKSTRRAKKKNKNKKQQARLEERRSVLAISVHSCFFPSKWGHSITLLMPAACISPPEKPERFEFSPLEKVGSKLLFTRRLSNPSSHSVNEPSRGFLSNAAYYVKSGRGY